MEHEMLTIRRISRHVRSRVARPRTLILLLVAAGLVVLVAARAGSPGRAESTTVRASGTSTILLEGYINYFPSGGPASNVSVTLSTTVHGTAASEAPDGSAGNASVVTAVLTQSGTADANGHYSFAVQPQCNVTHEITAVSTDSPDGDPLQPGIANVSGCVLNDTVVPVITIARPVPITFDGYIKYSDGSGASGVTVTMTRTKYDIGQTTTETKTTSGGHYQFQSWSRCSIEYEFRPSLTGREFAPAASTFSGCLLQNQNVIHMTLLGPPPPTPTPTPCPTCQCPTIPVVP